MLHAPRASRGPVSFATTSISSLHPHSEPGRWRRMREELRRLGDNHPIHQALLQRKSARGQFLEAPRSIA